MSRIKECCDTVNSHGEHLRLMWRKTHKNRLSRPSELLQGDHEETLAPIRESYGFCWVLGCPGRRTVKGRKSANNKIFGVRLHERTTTWTALTRSSPSLHDLEAVFVFIWVDTHSKSVENEYFLSPGLWYFVWRVQHDHFMSMTSWYKTQTVADKIYPGPAPNYATSTKV